MRVQLQISAKDAEGLFKSIDALDRPSSTLVLKPAFISTFTHLLCFIFIVRMSCSYMSLPLLNIQEANLFKGNKHVLSRRKHNLVFLFESFFFPKKRQRWSNSKQAESDSEDSAREMVVLSKEKYLEMEENLKILSESK